MISLQYKWEVLFYSDGCLHKYQKRVGSRLSHIAHIKEESWVLFGFTVAVTPQDTDNLLAPPKSHHNRCFLLAVQETPGQTTGKPV